MNAPDEARRAWDAIAAGYDRFVTPTHMSLAGQGLAFAGVTRGTRFLDVAAGSGALSIPAARLGAQVLATDLSSAMLEQLHARAASERLANIETRVMDGHALELPDASFDVVGSQFGVMLFPDMQRALREMARVARPGGRVLMTVFGDPRKVEFLGFFFEAVRSVVPGFTGFSMDDPPLPFQLREPARLRDALADAGLTRVRVETTLETLEFATGGELWDWLVSSNPIVGSVLGGLDLSRAQVETVRQALERSVRGRAGAGEKARLTNPINIGIGTR
jgi:ubiquinone/menaquinone biosynthesis C-methylase UbiE